MAVNNDTVKKNLKSKNQLETPSKSLESTNRKKPTKENLKIKDEFNNIGIGVGINLIPKKTEEEQVVEETKSKFNIGAALSILLFVLVSLLIVGYRYYQKINFEKEEQVLQNELEPEAEKHIDLILKNQELNKDLSLYEEVQGEAIPYKDILLYWEEVSENLGTIDEVNINQGLSFNISGKADNLDELAKLWHFMCVDEAISESNLESFSLGKDGVDASFKFKGKLNYDYFMQEESEVVLYD